MAVMKCKMCGGDIELSADKTIGVCEFCGSTMTFPKIDDEQRMAAFNRGNHFRRTGEFDKALSVYERIVQEDDTDAEAHWCCALCRFGIEYVEDPATHDWLPTCHRASFENFQEDVDYLAAVQHSDGVARRQYEKDGAKIEEVRRGILLTSQNEKPFDVFICYKESDENGNRTKDSTMAQEIYYQLTDQGRRVFFARITLEDKAGTQYEPYIFAALNSAKVMVVVGTKPEFFNAVWVKNEWSRYLALMKKDRTRLLLPCYAGMDPYDLPEQLAVLQSYDMSKIGFMQDLTRGIAKVLDANKTQLAAKETVVIQGEGAAQADALLKRGNMALEDGEWNKADEFFEQVLNLDAERAEAYWGKFLASRQLANGDQFVAAELKKTEQTDSETLTAYPEAKERIDAIVEQYRVPGYLEESGIRNICTFDRTYHSTLQARKRQLEQEKAELAADKMFSRAAQFAKGTFGKTLAATVAAVNDTMAQRVEDAKRSDAENEAAIRENYEKKLEESEKAVKELSEAEQAEREKDYQAACGLMVVAKSAWEYEKAIHEFDKTHGYKDTKAQIEKARETIKVLEKQKKENESRKKRRRLIIVAVVMSVVLASAVIADQVVIPAMNYNNAEKMYSEGDFEGAATAFSILGEYRDAPEKVVQAQNGMNYQTAVDLLNKGRLEDAAAAFQALGDYSDSSLKYDEAQEEIRQGKAEEYQKAEELLANGNTAAAAVAFGKAGDCKDARQRSMKLHGEVGKYSKIISAGGHHTVGLKSDGTVVATGYNGSGQCDVGNWTNAMSLSAGGYHTVGLKLDGTVIATGNNNRGQCDAATWMDIVAVSAGGFHTVGLKSDGTVVTTGYNDNGQCDVGAWTDIVAVSTSFNQTVGLKLDGTVVATGYNSNGQCDVESWTNVMSVSAGGYHTVGLKLDGTVIATGNNDDGQCDTAGWTGISAVSAGDSHTVGLKSDGTVIATGNNDDGQCNVEGWTDIVAVSAGSNYTIGLKSDGTVIATGKNADGQCDVESGTNIGLVQ